MINIIFDPSKNEINVAKHGIPLTAAGKFEWDDALAWQDVRKDYAEDRMCAIGYIGERLYCVTYVDRGETRRIISLRKANLREVKRYAEA